MKLKGEITINVSGDRVSIEIGDPRAAVDFLEITLTPAQFCAAMGRRMHTECELKFSGLDRVGKIHKHRKFEFPLPEKLHGYVKNKKELTAALCRGLLVEYKSGEWISDDYFGSQNSFFEKDGKPWARTTIRRWIDPEESQIKTNKDGAN